MSFRVAAGNLRPALKLYEKSVTLGIERAEQNVRNVSAGEAPHRKVASLVDSSRVYLLTDAMSHVRWCLSF